MRSRIIAASLIAVGMLAACDRNDGPIEQAGEFIDEAMDEMNKPDTLGEALEEAADETADAIDDAADDVDGAIDEAGEAMEEAVDPPQ